MITFPKDKETLLPAIIQDAKTKEVLMLGYMNAEALKMTQDLKKVTFFSRSKQRLWTKGETSGDFLWVQNIQLDCDEDTFLIQVKPEGNTCHNGTKTCWGNNDVFDLNTLQKILTQRVHNFKEGNIDTSSYTHLLLQKGLNKIAQKVGEEGVETVIASLNESEENFLSESADLLFHLLLLLQAKGNTLEEVLEVLKKRNSKK